jgi:uncharacterized membrane protein
MFTSLINSCSFISTADVVISVVGYVIVFIALLCLYAFFHFLPRLLFINLKRVLARKGRKPKEVHEVMVSGEVIAAVSMGLYLTYSELHDEDSGVLTIKKISRAYSPWSSKIYAVRNQFNRI